VKSIRQKATGLAKSERLQTLATITYESPTANEGGDDPFVWCDDGTGFLKPRAVESPCWNAVRRQVSVQR